MLQRIGNCYRNWLVWYLLTMLALILFGCASGPGSDIAIETDTEPSASSSDTVMEVAVEPPPVVPTGLDTSFVVQIDSVYGVMMNADTLEVFTVEAQQLEIVAQHVDTLASVLRFIEVTDDSDSQTFLSASDSAIVGRLLLQALAPHDGSALSVLNLDQALRDLSIFLERTDSKNRDLRLDLDDPNRSALATELKVAILGFAQQSQELRDQLNTILGGLDLYAQPADSARSQNQIKQLINTFGQNLDHSINEMGRVAQSVGPNSLSVSALRQLQQKLDDKRNAILALQAQWEQFVATGSLELADPGQPYNPQRMQTLLGSIYHSLGELAAGAQTNADWIDTAETFQSEFKARDAATQYLTDLQHGLMDMKESNKQVIQDYNQLSSHYWKPRLKAVASANEERDQLFEQLATTVTKAGGLNEIRNHTDLVASYKEVSSRLVAKRKAHLSKVAQHDRLRKSVQIDLARDLFNRARVLGEGQDYDEAIAVYHRLLSDEPGEYPYLFQMGSLSYYKSCEQWAEVDNCRYQAWDYLARCESVLLERFGFDRDMEQVRQTLDPTQVSGTAQDSEQLLQPKLADFLAAEDGYYYPSFLIEGWQDLEQINSALADQKVRQWMLSIDSLRKSLAFEAGDGDRFLYQYARQIYLTEDIDTEATRNLLKYWSWDAGNLQLKERWTEVAQLPDSTTVLAQTKRDSCQTILAGCRTEGARRAIKWTISTIDFLKLTDYDTGLDCMYTLLQEVDRHPNPNPEVGNIDSTIVNVYPVLLYNRGTYYQQAGQQREAFYCFLGVAEQYGLDAKIRAMAKYSAAALLADGNKKGALQLVRAAIGEAMQVLETEPTGFDPVLLVNMYELRQRLAGDLGLFSEAVTAREEARNLAALLATSNDKPITEGMVQ